METGRRYGNVRWELEYVWWTPPESFKARSSIRLLIGSTLLKWLSGSWDRWKSYRPRPTIHGAAHRLIGGRWTWEVLGSWGRADPVHVVSLLRRLLPGVRWGHCESWDGTGGMRGISWILCKLLMDYHVLLSCKYLLYDINDLHG